MINNILIKSSGFIIVNELQTKEKRRIVAGIGITFEGKTIISSYSNIISRFNGRQYGLEEIYFKPFAYLN